VLAGGPNPTDEGDLSNSLANSWLRQAENLVATYYGLSGDGQEMKIVYDTTPTAGVLAYVQASYSGTTGRSVPGTIQFHFDMSKYSNYTLEDGGPSIGGPATDTLDRTVAHEMTHAIMGRNMDFTSLPTWFIEGTAEYLRGADDRLSNDIAAAGGGAAGIAALVNGGWATGWSSSSADYSSAYSAVKYMDSKLQAAGKSMKDLMTSLRALTGPASLDTALTATIGMNTAAFVADFQTAGNGDTFVAGLNLTDSDMGAIGGGTATDSVPNVVNDPTRPLLHWRLSFPTDAEALTLVQVGANSGGTTAGQALGLPQVRVGAADLGVVGLDLSSQTGALAAIDRLDATLENLTAKRTVLGAVQNRLQYALTSIGVGAENQASAESRIREADVAATVSEMVKAQILRQVGTAMQAQSNTQPRLAVSLLS
jgi:flagellin